MTRLERTAVLVAVFLGGAMLMSLEVSAFRIIGKTFGSALRETTAVIAVFLAAMSVGYWAGGRAGDRWPRTSTLIGALMGAAATLLAVPWLDAATSPRIAASGLDFATHAFLATSLLFAIPTFLFATISPIAVRLMATTTGQSGSTAGSISAVSTAGSIIGSIATAFFLIDWLQSISRTVLFVSLGACITAAQLALASLPRMRAHEGRRAILRRYAVVVLGVVALIVLPAAVYVRSARLEHSLLQPSPHWKMLFVADSPYHRITVKESRGIRMLTFSMGPQGRMTVGDPYGPGLAYGDAMHIPRLMRPGIRRVLSIGLGSGTTPKQYTHYYDDTTVDAVEIDPMVVDVAKRFFALQPSDRLRVHVSDGRMFLKRSSEKWDFIVIDAYTTNRYGDTIPPQLTTQEFFREVQSHLNEGGIVEFHCAFRESKLLDALRKTMSSVFESVLVSHGEIYASDVALLTSKELLAERAAKSGRLPYVQAYIAALEPPPPALDAQLLTDDFAPIDTLARTKR